MRAETVTFIDHDEIIPFLTAFFGPVYEGHNWIADIDAQEGYANDTVQRLEIQPEAEWDREAQATRLAEAAARGRLRSSAELQAIMNAAAKDGDIATGLYIIEICW